MGQFESRHSATAHNPDAVSCPPMAKFASRYRTSLDPSEESEPGSDGSVLRNLLGIRTRPKMDRLEYHALTRAQERYTRRITPNTRLTAEILRLMHKEWLGEFYGWAGTYRTVTVTKAEFTWPSGFMVPRLMYAFERDVLSIFTPCRPDALESVVHRIAVVHAELIMIHPFREGNGRLARWVADIMALQAEYPAPSDLLGFPARGARKRRERCLYAVLAGYARNYLPLEDLFRDAILESLRRSSTA